MSWLLITGYFIIGGSAIATLGGYIYHVGWMRGFDKSTEVRAYHG